MIKKQLILRYKIIKKEKRIMSKPYKLPPTYEVNELDYEQKVNYKLRIFETIFPEKCHITVINTDIVIDKVLKDVDYIYEELTKN